MPRFINPKPQFSDKNGSPLAFGSLTFYDSGTTTEKTTFSDQGLSIPNSNPVPLDEAGRPQTSIFFDGDARVILKDRNGVVEWLEDPVSVNSSEPFPEWNSETTYQVDDIVKYQGGFYRAIAPSTNELPTNETFWSRIYQTEDWNPNDSYDENELVIKDNVLYISLVDNNTTDPGLNTVSWRASYINPAAGNDPANIVWDVDIPFNDSASIERGFGPITFTRSTGARVINKSGYMQSLAVDEFLPSIYGFQSHKSFTNGYIYSEDLTLAGGSLINVSVGTDTQVSPDTSLPICQKIIEDNTNNRHLYQKNAQFAASDNTPRTFSVSVKPNGRRYFSMQVRFRDNETYSNDRGAVFDLETLQYDLGNLENAAGGAWAVITPMSEGFVRITLSVASILGDGSDTAVEGIRFRLEDSFAVGTVYQGDGVSGIYLTQVNITDEDFETPYAQTAAASASVGTSNATIPVLNNFAPSKGLTIVFDVKDWDKPLSASSYALGLDGISVLKRSANNRVALTLTGPVAGSVTVEADNTNDELAGRKRIAVVWDGLYNGGGMRVYIDGADRTRSATDFNDSIALDITSTAAIAKILNSGYINASISNIKIKHSALSSSDILSLGGADV